MRRTCFSGDGRMTSRRWAPGGDTRYRERLRRAYRANRLLPDPWVIAEQTGREDQLPEGWDAWPTMAPMDVAIKLDAERVNADPYAHPTHWQDWLTFTERKNAERAAAREAAADRPSAHRTRSEQDAAAQMQRPQRHAQGFAYLDPEHPDDQVRVQVFDLADRLRLIVRKLGDAEDTQQYLIYDGQFIPDREARDLDDLDPDSGESYPTGQEGR